MAWVVDTRLLTLNGGAQIVAKPRVSRLQFEQAKQGRTVTMFNSLSKTLLWIWFSGYLGVGSAYAEVSMLLENVAIGDFSNPEQHQLVVAEIKDGELISVSTTAPRSPAKHTVLDAQGGFLLGSRALGKPASFLILTRDPRHDFDALQHPQPYTVFAIDQGVLQRNDLIADGAEAGQKVVDADAWTDSVSPTSELDRQQSGQQLWHQWQTGNTSVTFIAGAILDRMDWLTQNQASASRVGDLEAFDAGEVRDLRFGFVASLNQFDRPWLLSFFLGSNAFDRGFELSDQSDVTLYDLRLDIPLGDNGQLSIGKQKEVVSGERLQSAVFNQLQERSAVNDAMFRSRNIGVVYSDASVPHRTNWAVGAFNDWLDSDASFSNSDVQVTGRFAWAPVYANQGTDVLHAATGLRWSDGDEGFRFRSRPEFNNAPLFVDTAFGQAETFLNARDYVTWNAELAWKRGPFLIASEYARTEVNSAELGDPGFSGYWIAASWVLTGESRSYDTRRGLFGNMPVDSEVPAGGSGTWEVQARWSRVDLNDGPVQGGDMQIASVGVTWWLTQTTGVDLNYRYIWNDRAGLEESASGINTRVLLLLE